jgi:hypothetical protein
MHGLIFTNPFVYKFVFLSWNARVGIALWGKKSLYYPHWYEKGDQGKRVVKQRDLPKSRIWKSKRLEENSSTMDSFFEISSKVDLKIWWWLLSNQSDGRKLTRSIRYFREKEAVFAIAFPFQYAFASSLEAKVSHRLFLLNWLERDSCFFGPRKFRIQFKSFF